MTQSSPLQFSQLNLDNAILKGIDLCGYKHPTPVQAQSIPGILQGRDVVVSAHTGSGKTAAFVIPILQRLVTTPRVKKTRVLILTPTRELAHQIEKAARLYGKFVPFNIVSLLGGMPYYQQIRDLSRGADIVVATPGRLIDHIEQGRLKLDEVEFFVLDEADRMLDMGFSEDMEYIAKLLSASRQTLLFSATIDKKITTVIKHLLKNPIHVDLSDNQLAAPKITQEAYKTNSPQQKNRLLKHFLNDANIFKAIIFSATKIMADKLADQLRDEGFSAAALHGDLKQNVRNRTLDQLRKGKIQFLVATDVAARGIDISDITHVINYDLPRFCEDYVHRIGRTGRAGKSGIAISFVMPSDSRNLQRIERYIGQRLTFKQMAALPDLPKVANASYDVTTTAVYENQSTNKPKSFKRVSVDRDERSERSSRYSKNDRVRSEKVRSDGNDRVRSDRVRSDGNDRVRSDRVRSDGNDRVRSDRVRSDGNDRVRSDRVRSDRNDRARSARNDRGGRYERDQDKPLPFNSEKEKKIKRTERGESRFKKRFADKKEGTGTQDENRPFKKFSRERFKSQKSKSAFSSAKSGDGSSTKGRSFSPKKRKFFNDRDGVNR